MIFPSQKRSMLVAGFGLLTVTSIAYSAVRYLNPEDSRVVTTPQGIPLLIAQPGIHHDRALLAQRAQLFSTGPLVLSGQLEAQMGYARYNELFSGQAVHTLNLSGAGLDAAAFISPWTIAHLAVRYDDAPDSKSVLSLDRASIILGNFDVSPLYASVGQVFVPFGQYASNMLSSPLTKTLGKTKARALTLGFTQALNTDSHLGLEAFGFKGVSKTQGATDRMLNYGVNVDYSFKQPHWNANLGASYLSNLADSSGIQSKAGFPNDFMLKKAVPGLDMRGSVNAGPWGLSTEYVTATQAFSQDALAFNQKGAKPRAWYTEAAYRFNMDGRPVTIAAGYDCSWQALPLKLPKQSYRIGAQTTVFPNTTAGLEFRQDQDYSSADRKGMGKATTQGTGKTANSVSLQLTVSF
jgi:hypothetical protein